MSIFRAQTAKELAEDTSGREVAMELGAKYDGFAWASRAQLAAIFTSHGFTGAAGELDTDAQRALSETYGRHSKPICEAASRALARADRRSGRTARRKVFVRPLRAEKSKDKAVLSIGVYLETTEAGEKSADPQCGARVFVAADQVFAAAPVDKPEIAVCRKVAERIADFARTLESHANTPPVSNALMRMFQDAGAIPYISRGSYMLPVSSARYADVKACLADVRSAFYDPDALTGVYAVGVPIKTGDDISIDAVCRSIVKDFESRCDDLAGSLREAASKDKVRGLEGKRDKCDALLADLAEHEGILGRFADKFRGIANAARGAYNGAIAGQKLELPDVFGAVADASAPAPAAPAAPATTTDGDATPAPATPPSELDAFDF